jgi:hypothetical protein
MEYSQIEMIQQTRKWVQLVVVGQNFCPFAAKEVKDDTILYKVAEAGTRKASVKSLLLECIHLDAHPEIETTLLIFPNRFELFEDYLQLVEDAEQMIFDEGYEGTYQLASFHPLYLFEGSDETDAANYTNRSTYPMIHLLRELSLEKAINQHANTESIPDRNIAHARKKGLDFMIQQRDSCFLI